MEKIYLEKRFYPRQPIWTVSFLCGLSAIAAVFLTLSFIYANIQPVFKISISYDIINFISTPIACSIMLFSFWYIPARLNSDLSYIKVNDLGVEFSDVNLKLQTITGFLKWLEIETFEMVNRKERGRYIPWTHLCLKTKANQRYTLPRPPFQTKADRKHFFYDTEEFIKKYNPEIIVIVDSIGRREIFY